MEASRNPHLIAAGRIGRPQDKTRGRPPLPDQNATMTFGVKVHTPMTALTILVLVFLPTLIWTLTRYVPAFNARGLLIPPNSAWNWNEGHGAVPVIVCNARILDRLLGEEVSLRLLRSESALQFYSLHCRHRDAAESYQHSQAAMDSLAAERHFIGTGSTRDRIVDKGDVHRTRALARESERLEDQVKVAGAKLTAVGNSYRQAGKSGQRVVRR